MSSFSVNDWLNRAWRRSTSQPRPSQGEGGSSVGATAGPSSAPPTTVVSPSFSQYDGILIPRHRFQLIPSHDTVGQDAAVEKVCAFLRNVNVGIVGIYGMGGVGKTTLMKMVHNKFLVGCDFDLILWVVASKEWDYDKIRKIIITRLGVGPFDPNVDVDAMDLFNFLESKRFVLLIDDVWEHLDLMELGVPYPTNKNKSKIIFTTRLEEVCRQMRPDREIKVDCLGPSDSWALFEKNVGGKALNSHPRVHSLARQVAKECCGLPLALIIVGRAMSSKYAPEEWKHALEVLENHPHQMPGIVNKLFSCLELSYLSLGEDTSQKCFLYCSLFPEDFSIQKEKLVDYWMGEGFLGECENLEQLRNRGYHIIGVLLAACLIENGTGEEDKEVKMHDVIRDMALWIVSDHGAKQNRFFVHPGHRLTSSEIHVRWSMAERIFVQDFNELPKLPSCPVLTTLIFDKDAQLAFKRSWYKNLENDRAKDLGIGERQIKGKGPLSDPEPDPVPSSSNAIDQMPLVDDPMSSLFQSMPNLRLLELSFCLMSDLPKAVMELPKLRYLSSAGVKYLSPKVGKLSNLEILDMSCLIKPAEDVNSPFLVDLPDTIVQLLELRLLNLKGMWLKSLPQEIGRLSKLEILDLSNTPIFFLPTGIRGLRELRQLKLSGTMLHSIPEEMVYLSKLEILDLSKTKISDLPWRIYWLGKLRQLNLENTLLVELPKEMFYLSKLEILNLSKSQIRELPNMIRGLSELRQLDLRDTLLKTLPKEIGFLLKLEILNLSGSARIDKHYRIMKLCELRELNLKGTQLLEWWVDMSKLTKLEILDLSFAPIGMLPSTISWLVELRQLNLEATFICRLEEEVLRNLSKLEILNLNRTLIRELPTWINRLHQLRELYLDKTPLKILPKEVGDLAKLEILSLSKTCIEEIPSWIGQLPELKELNLTGTPWHQVNLRRSGELLSRAATPPAFPY